MFLSGGWANIVPMDTDATYDADFDAALASHLASCGRSGGYRVLETLKRSDFEVTEKVAFVGEGDGSGTGELGPFVRKRIDASCGLGAAYGRLLATQRAGLRCPNLPRVIDCWNDGQWFNVVMEWLPGVTLEEYVRTAGPSRQLASDVAMQVAAAVAWLHAGLGGKAPIIHRDLKPSNVMVVGGADGIPPTFVVIDLGIARTWHEDAEADTTRLGTRSYAPPEQFGFGQTSVRSDVYALGALLCFCLTGDDPAPGKSAAELVARADVPSDLGAVIAKAMSFDPDDRYASVADLAQAVVGEKPSDLMSRIGVPASWGHVWNILLVLLAAVLIAASVANFVAPAENSAGHPTWFLALEYLLWLPVSFAVLAYLLADKRRLRNRLPRLACAAILAATLLLVIIAGMAGGVL